MQLGEARLDAKVTVHHINITRHRFTPNCTQIPMECISLMVFGSYLGRLGFFFFCLIHRVPWMLIVAKTQDSGFPSIKITIYIGTRNTKTLDHGPTETEWVGIYALNNSCAVG